MSVFFNAYIMIGCSCYFLLTSVFLPDVPLITIREMRGLGLELPGLGLDFYNKVSVSS